MSHSEAQRFVSRGGEKLWAALEHFGLDVSGLVCADLGSHVGGFVDCLLQRETARVHSVDTAYGILAWKLRKDPRVIAHERTNALHARLPELVDLITIDVGWTRQAAILPAARTMLRPAGHVVTLIKPHYEAPLEILRNGVLPDDRFDEVNARVLNAITQNGWEIQGTCASPIRGQGGNRELFGLLRDTKNA